MQARVGRGPGRISPGLTCLFIGHDLAVVTHISDQGAVMYPSVIVRSRSSDQICEDPQNDRTSRE